MNKKELEAKKKENMYVHTFDRRDQPLKKNIAETIALVL